MTNASITQIQAEYLVDYIKHLSLRRLRFQSALMRAAFMTLAHLSASTCMRWAICSGEFMTVSYPSLTNRSRTDVDWTAFSVSRCNVLPTLAAVPAGSKIPTHDV